MILDINKSSYQFLTDVFSSLNNYSDYVFWIRNFPMTKQIYVSDNYKKIWNRDPAPTFQAPLIWFDYLSQEHKLQSMIQLQNRHDTHYENAKQNIAYYQIAHPNGAVRHIQCQCFKCEDHKQQQFVIGFAQDLPSIIWNQSSVLTSIYNEDHDIIAQAFNLLERHFGIVATDQIRLKDNFLDEFRMSIIGSEEFIFTERELECLYHTCTGKTAKETAIEMHISYRTVETYIENIRDKTTAKSKRQIIGLFSRYLRKP